MIAKEVVGGSCCYCYPKSNFTDFVTFSVVSTKNKKVPKMSALFEKAHLDLCPSSGMIDLSCRPIMTSIIKSPKFRQFAKTKYRRLDENLTFVALLFTALNSEHWFIKTHFQDCGGVALSWMHLCALEGEWSDAFVSLAPSPSLRYFKQKSFCIKAILPTSKNQEQTCFPYRCSVHWNAHQTSRPTVFRTLFDDFFALGKKLHRLCSVVGCIERMQRRTSLLRNSAAINTGDPPRGFPWWFWSTTRFINFSCGAHSRWFVSGSQPLIRDTLVCFRHTTGGCMCGTKPWLSLQAVMSMCLHATVIACGVFHRW